MQVRFWGTRGSIATPGPQTAEYGGNTSCVEVRTDAGDLFVLDCGTGARLLGDALSDDGRRPVQGHLLIGHSHWEHIHGFPFFKPGFTTESRFDVYAPAGGQRSLHDVLAGQMEFTYFPVELAQLPARIECHELGEGEHAIGGARVFAQYLHHPASTLGYRIEADGAVVVYLVDHEPYADALWRSDGVPGRIDSILHDGDRRHARFMADADLVIHDAQYTPEERERRRGWGHSSYDYAVELAMATGVRHLALTHHDPTRNDGAVAQIERRARGLAAARGAEIEVFCAWEGCSIELRGREIRRPFRLAGPPAAVVQERVRVLVVDDDPDVRALVVRTLTEDGHVVIEAANGREALARIDGVQLVLLDLEMPEMSGLDVLRALRQKPETASLPVLVLTVHHDERSTYAGFAQGATDYLATPFQRPQLAARVRACLARSATRTP